MINKYRYFWCAEVVVVKRETVIIFSQHILHVLIYLYGQRSRFNSYLSFSMARYAILARDYISQCYFPCVLGVSLWTATPTYAVRLDPSWTLSHRVTTFFHIWFLKTKYFNILSWFRLDERKEGKYWVKRTSSRGVGVRFKKKESRNKSSIWAFRTKG